MVRCAWPWQPSSCPCSCTSRMSAGWRSATQPTTKKVAETPRASRMSSSRCVLATTRDGRRVQSARSTRPRTASTWKYSSRSMVSALRISEGDDLLAVLADLSEGVADVDDQRRLTGDRRVVEDPVIGDEHRAMRLGQRLRCERRAHQLLGFQVQLRDVGIVVAHLRALLHE